MTDLIDGRVTAISEVINVYSTAVAPWVFFINRRKIGVIPSLQLDLPPVPNQLRENTYREISGQLSFIHFVSSFLII